LQRNLWRFIKQKHSVLHKKDSSGATREKRVFWEVLFAIVQSVRLALSGGAGSVVGPAPSKIKRTKEYLQRSTKSSVFCTNLGLLAICCAKSINKIGNEALPTENVYEAF
jgi:hypothetical protein